MGDEHAGSAHRGQLRNQQLDEQDVFLDPYATAGVHGLSLAGYTSVITGPGTLAGRTNVVTAPDTLADHTSVITVPDTLAGHTNVITAQHTPVREQTNAEHTPQGSLSNSPSWAEKLERCFADSPESMSAEFNSPSDNFDTPEDWNGSAAESQGAQPSDATGAGGYRQPPAVGTLRAYQDDTRPRHTPAQYTAASEQPVQHTLSLQVGNDSAGSGAARLDTEQLEHSDASQEDWFTAFDADEDDRFPPPDAFLPRQLDRTQPGAPQSAQDAIWDNPRSGPPPSYSNPPKPRHNKKIVNITRKLKKHSTYKQINFHSTENSNKQTVSSLQAEYERTYPKQYSWSARLDILFVQVVYLVTHRTPEPRPDQLNDKRIQSYLYFKIFIGLVDTADKELGLHITSTDVARLYAVFKNLKDQKIVPHAEVVAWVETQLLLQATGNKGVTPWELPLPDFEDTTISYMSYDQHNTDITTGAVAYALAQASQLFPFEALQSPNGHSNPVFPDF